MEEEEYNKYKVEINKPDKYSITKKIGQGRYSNVFIGLTNELNSKEEQVFAEFEKYTLNEYNIYERMHELKNNFAKQKLNLMHDFRKCIIKVLKPNKEFRFKREVYILKRLNHPNILKLIDTVEDSFTNHKSLIFDYFSSFNTKLILATIDIDDVIIYAKQMLLALDYAHKQGIIHRDIKPNNIVINPLTKTLIIIDWGIAEQIEYCNSSKVGTRGFKAPELIFDLHYDYKIDVWAFGCVFAEMILKRQLFKEGKDFQSMIPILGKTGLDEFLLKYNISFILEEIDCYENSDWDLIEEIEDKRIRKVLDSALAYDKDIRYSCADLLLTKFFKN